MTNLPRQYNSLFFFLGLAILYGVYFLFIEPKLETTEEYKGKQSPELVSFMSDILANLDREAPTELYTAIIYSAENNWSSDPFYDMKSYGELTMSKTQVDKDYVVREADFIYSGYLNVHGSKIAIVNDIECAAGDKLELEKGLFILKDIHPNKVVIGNKTGSLFLEVPLQKTEE